MALIEHLEKLRHFYKLTKYKSINEASLKLGLSQSGLSKSLTLLESELGCKLFKRSRDGLTLTHEGEYVLKSTQKIIDEAVQLENYLSSVRALDVPKKLRIGMYDSIAVYFGLDLNSYMASIYPNVKMELYIDSSAKLVEKIKREELDIAVGINYEKYKSHKLKYFKLFDDYYSYYVSAKSQGKTDKLPLIIHEFAADSSGTALANLIKKPVPQRVIHYAQNFETIKILVAQDFGIGILPNQVARPLVRNGQLLNVELSKQPHFFGRHTVDFLILENSWDSFSDFIQDIYRLGIRWSKM